MLGGSASLRAKPDLNHTEYAYREAVNRLKFMLADSYNSCKANIRHSLEPDSSDAVSVGVRRPSREPAAPTALSFSQTVDRPDLSEFSKSIQPSYSSRYANPSRFYSPRCHGNAAVTAPLPSTSTALLRPADYGVKPATLAPAEAAKPPVELMQFIEKQEGYIEQLERESQFCRVSSTGAEALRAPLTRVSLRSAGRTEQHPEQGEGRHIGERAAHGAGEDGPRAVGHVGERQQRLRPRLAAREADDLGAEHRVRVADQRAGGAAGPGGDRHQEPLAGEPPAAAEARAVGGLGHRHLLQAADRDAAEVISVEADAVSD